MLGRARAAGLLLIALGGCLGASEGGGDGGDDDAGVEVADAGPPVECEEASDCTFGDDPDCSCGQCTHVDFDCDAAGRRYTTADGGGGACVPAPVQIDSGYQHTCAVWSNGRVSCWGYDCEGQLGDLDAIEPCAFDDPTPPRSLVPVTVQGASGVGPLEGVLEVATTYASSCARLEDGTVWCWGGNGSGQLGNGSIPGPSPRPVQVIDVDDQPLERITSLAAGGHHMCALDLSGSAWCWGDNSYAQLGVAGWQGDTDQREKALLAEGGPYTSISAGGAHTCGVVGTGALARVWCWGRNNLGQLGASAAQDPSSSEAPVVVLRETTGNPQLAGPTSIGMGNNFSCAGVFPLSIWCWGQNLRHALGDQAMPAGADGATAWLARANVHVPATSVVQVAAGEDVACARLGNGDVYCWGGNVSGQVGIDSELAYEPPSRVRRDAEALAVGFSEACVITSDRRVLCWGANTNGQLGDGTETSRREPTEVRELCQ